MFLFLPEIIDILSLLTALVSDELYVGCLLDSGALSRTRHAANLDVRNQ